ncbi:MAG: vanadium-dependent haloperoxidase [Cyclobacteriaceae bacterium]|nr:vanadium-dependent haloperoxidase [Cyclobacteriaceae bacterium]
MKKFLTLLLAAIFIFGCSKKEPVTFDPGEVDPGHLHRTMKKITDIIVHDIFSPPVASRIYAYSSIAAYEAAVPGNAEYVSLAGQLNGLTETPKPDTAKQYCFELASVHALALVGKALIFSEAEMLTFHEQTLAEFKSSGMPKGMYENSVAYGEEVAKHILAWSGSDNYKQTRTFEKYTVPLHDPSKWRPTPPAYMDGIEPSWNKIRPFVIDSANQFVPEPPTPFSTEPKSKFYQEAMEVFEAVKSANGEYEEIANFWDCNPFKMNVRGHVMFATKKISPGGHWINITNLSCRIAKNDFFETAEAYTRVSLALADGFIVCWDEKYRSKLVRPETYINQFIDEDWLPLLQTPPFPEHTSGHSVISAAASVILTDLYGEDFHFVDSTELEFGLPARTFTSFKHASDEAAISRLYGGIHYRPAIDEGVKQGVQVGEWVMMNIRTRRENRLVNN